jgi:predicted metalloprotease
VELNKDADIDTSQVTDRRGSGFGFGGGGIPIPVGGGIIGTLLVIGLVILGSVMGPQMFGGDDGGDLAETCSTANPNRLEERECRNTLYVNSIQNYWQRAMPETFGKPYQATDTVFFSQAVSTACGNADSGVGPFYCPLDGQVYIDLTFYDELARRFGAKGEFAQPYVLAHEYGHHLQNLLGTSTDVRRRQERDPEGANELSVRLELQADCYAGVWAHHASSTTDVKGVPIFKSVTQADIDQALEAAAAIGDDMIQRKSGTRVDESKFTHGTSEQRQRWFKTGFDSGDGKRCDTFSGAV